MRRVVATVLLAGSLAGAGCGGDDGCPETRYDYGEGESGFDTPEDVLEAEAIASVRLPDDLDAYESVVDGAGNSTGDKVTYTFVDAETDATLVARRGDRFWVLDSTRICTPEP